ncbi:MAG: hypothetical protein PHY43_07535 [Verrucomicrobiales bacterium]|nr:hypothetical protein [Verrucomicrobiales bacterium]
MNAKDTQTNEAERLQSWLPIVCKKNMSRTIALLGLAQAAAVICGFFGLAIILRRYGYPDEPYHVGSNFGTIHWSQLTLFLRRLGMILLFVPLAWTVFAVISERRSTFILPFSWWLIVGTIIPPVIVLMFFYAIFHPCITVPN